MVSHCRITCSRDVRTTSVTTPPPSLGCTLRYGIYADFLITMTHTTEGRLNGTKTNIQTLGTAGFWMAQDYAFEKLLILKNTWTAIRLTTVAAEV